MQLLAGKSVGCVFVRLSQDHGFPHPLAHALAFFAAHHVLKKYLYASFSFSYWKYNFTLSIFLLFSPTRS